MKEAVQKIRKDVWAYIICILAVAFIWSLVFDSLTSIKTKEKVSVFIGSYAVVACMHSHAVLGGFESHSTVDGEISCVYRPCSIVCDSAHDVLDAICKSCI